VPITKSNETSFITRNISDFLILCHLADTAQNNTSMKVVISILLDLNQLTVYSDVSFPFISILLLSISSANVNCNLFLHLAYICSTRDSVYTFLCKHNFCTREKH